MLIDSSDDADEMDEVSEDIVGSLDVDITPKKKGNFSRFLCFAGGNGELIQFAVYKTCTCKYFVLGERTPLKSLRKFSTKSPIDIPKPERKRKAPGDLDIDLEDEFEEADPPIDIDTGNF